MVEQSDVDRVREAVDLVALIGEHIPLQLRGREHVGVCPFHDDRTPSLTVVTHKGNAFYKCHACGAAGDAFNFVMDYHKMSFPEALELLAERTSITLHRGPRGQGSRPEKSGRDVLRHANGLAGDFFRATLLNDRRAVPAREVLTTRGIADETAERFQIGAAPPEWDDLIRHAGTRRVGADALADAGLAKARSNRSGHYDTFRNRLVFPICDELGRPIAFGGRRLDPDDEPKYLNSPETPVFQKSRTLYALHLAKRAIIEHGQVIVTEGYTDVVACHQAGFENVVATLGTALTADHVRVLMRLCEEIVLVFDGDEAGQRAADRAIELVFAEPVDVKICVLPGGADPADVLAEADGPDRLRAAIEAATDALAFKVSRFRDELAAARGPAGRQRSLTRLLNDLARLGFHQLAGVRKQPVIAQLAELLNVRMEDIEQAMPSRRGVTASREATPDEGSGTPASALFDEDVDVPKRRGLAERELLGVVLFRPALRHERLDETGENTATLLQSLQPGDFADPASRRLAEVIWPRLERDEDFSVQQLMSELDAALRSLAGDLFLEAERRLTDGRESPIEHLRARCAALEQLARRDRFEQDLRRFRRQDKDGEGGDTPDAEALQRVLEERRKQGYIPEALPARIRT